MSHTCIHLPLLPSLTGGVEGRKVKIPTLLPVVFSAGPIRNAQKWHSDAIRIVLTRDEEIFFACPARRLDTDLMCQIEQNRPEYEEFPRQRAWEQYYMYKAGKKGCVFFWLCQEAAVKEHQNKSYAQITMMELGKWIERKKFIPETRLVIGTDGKFPEWSTIEYEINTELPELPIYRSLEATVHAALDVATSKN